MPLKAYLASPFGFNPEHEPYRKRLRDALAGMGHEVLDPWDEEYDVPAGPSGPDYEAAEMEVGGRNQTLIEGFDAVLAVLDGMEPDSGVAAEVGFAFARGKTVYALRCDRRPASDLPGRSLNVQVGYFVRKSGGLIFLSVESVAF